MTKILENRSRPRTFSLTPFSLFLPALAVTAILWATRASPVTGEQALCSFLLFLFPWGSFLAWKQRKRGGLPVFAIVGLTYWWYFTPAMFWTDRLMQFGRGSVPATEDLITGTLRLTLVGVLCMWTGMKLQLPVLVPSRQPQLMDDPTSWAYVRLILVMGTLASLAPGATGMLGTGGRQIMEILISIVPTVALMLLLRRYLEGKGSPVDRFLLCIYFPVKIVLGLASGWMGSIVNLGLICGATYFLVRRKIPWTLIAVSVAAVLFLQVGKNTFRKSYWYTEGASGGIVEGVMLWVNESASKWSEAMESSSGGGPGALAAESLERTSLLTQVAHVIDVTPKEVPFLEGSSYSYLALTLIPRFVWPDKPSMNEANQYYQVVFGLTAEQDLGTTSIGIGCLGEAYINFGWPGVVGIMFGIGVVLGIYERSFAARGSSALFLAIGLALLPEMIGIQAQMAQYLGGLVQRVLLTILVFLPVIRGRLAGAGAFRKTPQRASAMGRLRARPSH